MRKYQPLQDRVLLRLIKPPEEEKTESGILLGTVARQTQEAEVVGVGAGAYAFETGTFMPTVLAKGDIVLIPFNHGMDIDTDEEKGLKIMREGDVICLIKKSTDNG